MSLCHALGWLFDYFTRFSLHKHEQMSAGRSGFVRSDHCDVVDEDDLSMIMTDEIDLEETRASRVCT